MDAQDPANYIFIDRDAESQGDLLGNAGRAPGWIPPFHFDNGADEFFLRPLWARPTSTLRREQHAVLAFPQQVVETQVPHVVLVEAWTSAWPKGAGERTHRRRCRNETAESHLGLSPHGPADRLGFRRRDR